MHACVMLYSRKHKGGWSCHGSPVTSFWLGSSFLTGGGRLRVVGQGQFWGWEGVRLWVGVGVGDGGGRMGRECYCHSIL